MISLAHIHQHIARRCRVAPDSLLLRTRRVTVAWPRQLVMFFARRQGYKLREIGAYFGLDTATVACGVQRVGEELRSGGGVCRAFLVHLEMGRPKPGPKPPARGMKGVRRTFCPCGQPAIEKERGVGRCAECKAREERAGFHKSDTDNHGPHRLHIFSGLHEYRVAATHHWRG